MGHNREMALADRQLQGKIAVVTGASSGIGQAVAHHLAEAGACVLGAAIDLPPLPPEPFAPLQPGQLLLAQFDVAQAASVDQLFGWLDNRGQTPDFLVNAAGLGRFAGVLELSDADWQALLAVNLLGSWLCSQRAAQRMQRRGQGGRLVQIGSVANLQPLAGNAAYAASKAGLRAASSVLNLELHPYGINSTFVSLGAVYTPAWQARPEFQASDMLSVADVARCIVDLLAQPTHLRIDEITLQPPKGVL